MPGATLRLAVIIGSVRDGRFGPTVADWFVEQAKVHGEFALDLVDLVDSPLQVAMRMGSDSEAAASPNTVSPALAAADAFVVVTPEYNHSFPASLKAAIDWHHGEWHAKPVGFVSYGGMSGGLRAVEHLRQVFAELHAMTVRDTVSFHNPWSDFGEQDSPSTGEVELAAKRMLDQLVWWADALREARSEQPYVG